MTIQQLTRFWRVYPTFGLVVGTFIGAVCLQVAGMSQLAIILLTITSLIAIVPIVKDMVETVREGGYGLDILALTAILVSLAMGEYWTAIVIVLMLTGGEALEGYAQTRATHELTALVDRAPRYAHLLKRTQTEDVVVEAVKVGDRLLVKPGETVPVDGELIEGITTIDESSLTGESLPITKQPGEQVLSGTINIDAPIIKAVHTSNESQYAQIIKLVKEASTSRSPFVRLADRYSVPFTAVSFAIAFIAWGLSGDPRRFLEVIVVATPCPLLLGAPIAIISGMSRAAKHGIIIKNGAALERLAAVRSIAFDKTGTLTKGRPILTQIVSYGELDEPSLLGLAAAVEHRSAHILAQAVVDAAKRRKVKSFTVEEIKEVPGFGLKATWRDKPVLIGSLMFMERQSVQLPPAFDGKAVGETTTFVAVSGKVAGAFSFADEIREESARMVGELRQAGLKHISMLTGDNQSVAAAVAKKLHITEIYANLLPVDKVRVLKEIPSAFHPTAMVGDGVNDAPVLAASDVGIALGARGSTAASESADVVIMLDEVRRVSRAITIAKRTIYIGKQSILAGIAISVGLMLVFSTGRFPPVLGAALQEVVDVVVILNALRAHGKF